MVDKTKGVNARCVPDGYEQVKWGTGAKIPTFSRKASGNKRVPTLEALANGFVWYSKTYEAGGAKFMVKEACSAAIFIIPICPPIQKIDKYDQKYGCSVQMAGSWVDPTSENPIPTRVGKAVPVWNKNQEGENTHQPKEEFRPVCKAGKVYPKAKVLSVMDLADAD